MSNGAKSSFFTRSEVGSSVVTALVLLPSIVVLCNFVNIPVLNGLLGYGLALVFCGFYGEKKFHVNAPTTSLAMICFSCLAEHGFAGMCLMICVGGGIQVLLGAIKAGSYFRILPQSMIKGLLSGIGISIVISQMPKLLGHNSFSGLNLDSFTDLSAILGLGCLAMIFLWSWVAPKKIQSYIPGVLFALVATIAVSYFIGIRRETASSLSFQVPWLEWPRGIGQGKIFFYALTFTAVASLKSILTAIKMEAVSNKPADLNRELMVHGAANFACGILGGLPVASHLSRSVINYELGARSVKNIVGQVICLLLFIVAGKWLLEYLPATSMAAVLLYCGYKLVDISFYSNPDQVEKTDRYLAAITCGFVVFSGVHFGLTVGLALTMFRLTATLSRDLQFDLQEIGEKDYCLTLKGAVTFLHLPKLYQQMSLVPTKATVKVETQQVYYFDPACIAFFVDWQKSLQKEGGQLRMNYIKLLQKSNFTVEQREAALEELRKMDRRQKPRHESSGRRQIDRILYSQQDLDLKDDSKKGA